MLLGWPTAATHHGIRGKRFLAQFDSDEAIGFEMGDFETLRFYIDADSVNAKPLSKVYVKVYARLADGSVKFHKDGYTDLRGRFDYASVNTPERQAIQKFAVLVLSDTKGAVIREAAPPQQ